MKKDICLLFVLFLLVVSPRIASAVPPNNALGDNLIAIDTINGNAIFAVYSGDIDDGSLLPLQDGYVDALDFLIMDADIQVGASGYLSSDLNGDGFTDAFDFLYLDPAIQQGYAVLRPY